MVLASDRAPMPSCNAARCRGACGGERRPDRTPQPWTRTSRSRGACHRVSTITRGSPRTRTTRRRVGRFAGRTWRATRGSWSATSWSAATTAAKRLGSRSSRRSARPHLTRAAPTLVWTTFDGVPAGEAFARRRRRPRRPASTGERAAPRRCRLGDDCDWIAEPAGRPLGYTLDSVDGPYPEASAR